MSVNMDFGNTNLKKKQKITYDVLRCLSKSNKPLTIPNIANFTSISIPSATNIVKNFINLGIINNKGKQKSENGRHPYTYSLNRERFYVIGVEILSNFAHTSILQTNLDTIYEVKNRDFELRYDKENLITIVSMIEKTINESKIDMSHIISIGIGILDSYEPFSISKNKTTTLIDYLKNKFGIPIFIENDTRSIGASEQIIGLAKGVNDALVIKVSRLMGMCIIANKKIITGKNGFAGNFTHTHYECGKRSCVCGKTGCIGTLVGGNALIQDFKNISNSRESAQFINANENYSYHDILNAAKKGNSVCIKLIQNQGITLGKALGNVINLLNPELIIISGEYTSVENIFLNAVRLGTQQTTIHKSLKNCTITSSNLGRYLSSKAGACIALKAIDMVDY